jgi:hypothetical protein
MDGKVVITIEKKRGKVDLLVQRSANTDRSTYKELLKYFMVNSLDVVMDVAKDIPVKEKDTYENTNRN